MRILFTVATAVAVFAQPPEPVKGRAKDVFFDTSSTVVVYVPQSRPRPQEAKRTPPPAAPRPIVLPSSVGIRYHVELLSDGGEALPVSASRPFSSGERIRLHVTTNVGGRLTVLQSVNGAPPVQLFPGPKTTPEESIVRAHTPLVIPARGFRFQAPAGEIILTVRVDPELRPAPAVAAPPALAASTTAPAVVPTSAPITPDSSLSAEIADIPSIADTLRQQGEGRKSLVLEDDGADTTIVQKVSDKVEPLITAIKLRQVK